MGRIIIRVGVYKNKKSRPGYVPAGFRLCERQLSSAAATAAATPVVATTATAAIVTDEAPTDEAERPAETPMVIRVLARILVRQAMEEAGLAVPANDNA